MRVAVSYSQFGFFGITSYPNPNIARGLLAKTNKQNNKLFCPERIFFKKKKESKLSNIHTNPLVVRIFATHLGDLAFPRLPQIAVFKRGQRNATKKQPLAYVPMERLEIFDDKQLIFACVRLARLQQLPPTNEQAVQPECLIEI